MNFTAHWLRPQGNTWGRPSTICSVLASAALFTISTRRTTPATAASGRVKVSARMPSSRRGSISSTPTSCAATYMRCRTPAADPHWNGSQTVPSLLPQIFTKVRKPRAGVSCQALSAG